MRETSACASIRCGQFSFQLALMSASNGINDYALQQMLVDDVWTGSQSTEWHVLGTSAQRSTTEVDVAMVILRHEKKVSRNLRCCHQTFAASGTMIGFIPNSAVLQKSRRAC